MGSILTFSLYGESSAYCREVTSVAFREVRRLEKAISLFDPSSSLSMINRLRVGERVQTDPDLVQLISLSQDLSRRTQGAFDITVGPLMRCWGFRGEEKDPLPPSLGAIQDTLQLVGYGKIRAETVTSTVEHLARGIEIDLGGIGKGYGVDRIVEIFKQYGIMRALVSFRSVGYALGTPPGKSGWTVGIQDPKISNRVLEFLNLKDVAFSTSGDYQQFLRQKGRIYAHIIDPRSGHPTSGITSVTIVSPKATLADALSTGVLVLGGKEGMKLLAAEDSVEGYLIAVTDDGRNEILSTRGFSHFQAKGPRRILNRRKFVKAAIAAFGSLLLKVPVLEAKIFCTPEDAVKILLPETETFHRVTVTLDKSQMDVAQKLVGKRFLSDTYIFFPCFNGKEEIAHAVILDVIGKERPITFLVAVRGISEVAGVEVLAYRESIGGEIRSRRFLKQFLTKTLSSPLRLGYDIQAITGATLSSRSTAYAVKKGLALVHAVYSEKRTDQQ